MSSVDFLRYKRMVQSLWDPEPINDDSSGACLWCLGKAYIARPISEGNHDSINGRDEEVSSSYTYEGRSACVNGIAQRDARNQTQEVKNDRGWPSDFLDDCESRAWFTYRSNFPSIKKSTDASLALSVRFRNLGDHAGFTSDTGWGCMIRSGQSLLANALFILHLGREWRRGSRKHEEKRLLSLFADDPAAPFSIHRFVEHGASACGKHPGEWFGPSATARCIQALSHKYAGTEIKVYINGDGADVYQDRVFNLAKEEDGTFRPTLILVGVRLGIDRVTPAYWDALKATLHLPQAVGIAGGRPSSSHYFFGTQGDQFFYLDPHITRPALHFTPISEDFSEEELNSCHTRRLRRLHVKDIDPSMLLAFLIRDEQDWRSWRQAITDVRGKAVVHVADKEVSMQDGGADREGAVDDVESFDDEEGIEEFSEEAEGSQTVA